MKKTLLGELAFGNHDCLVTQVGEEAALQRLHQFLDQATVGLNWNWNSVCPQWEINAWNWRKKTGGTRENHAPSVVGEPQVYGKLMFIRKYYVCYHVMLDEWCSEKCFWRFLRVDSEIFINLPHLPMHITIPFAACNYQGDSCMVKCHETCALGKFLYTVVLRFLMANTLAQDLKNGPLEEGITNFQNHHFQVSCEALGRVHDTLFCIQVFMNHFLWAAAFCSCHIDICFTLILLHPSAGRTNQL